MAYFKCEYHCYVHKFTTFGVDKQPIGYHFDKFLYLHRLSMHFLRIYHRCDVIVIIIFQCSRKQFELYHKHKWLTISLSNANIYTFFFIIASRSGWCLWYNDLFQEWSERFIAYNPTEAHVELMFLTTYNNSFDWRQHLSMVWNDNKIFLLFSFGIGKHNLCGLDGNRNPNHQRDLEEEKKLKLYRTEKFENPMF